MLVVTRFRVPVDETAEFQTALEEALAALAAQPGHLEGRLGRNVDDPELWVLQTRWVGPGAYRRALSAYDVKMRAWALLGRALDEPTAFELLAPGERSNQPRPRGDDQPQAVP